nr:AHH domain-containing protein [Pseudomonas lundensis]
MCSSKLDRALKGASKDGMQAHHLIPEQVWKAHASFFTDIGMYAQIDDKQNGLLIPSRADKAKEMKRKFYHCGPHGVVYSPMVNNMIEKVQRRFSADLINEAQARAEISEIQSRLRSSLLVSGKKQRRVR